MAQWTATEDAAGSITLPCRFVRASDVTDEDFNQTPIKFITVETGHSYSEDTVNAKVLPYGMEEDPSNYVIIPVPTNGLPVPITPIKNIDFGGSDLLEDTYTILWMQ